MQASAGVGLNQAGAGGWQGIVDRAMTQGTLNPNRLERSGGVEEAGHADNSIQFEEGQGRCRIVEIHLAMVESRKEIGGEGVHVDLEAHRQGGFRTDAGTNAA